MNYSSITCVLAALFAFLPSLSSAATISLLFERNVNSGAGTELFVQDYPSQTDLLANTNGTGSFSAIDVAGSFSLGGAFYDGTYNLLLEREVNSGAGTELFLQSYPTISDLLANTNGTGSFSAIDVAGSFSLGGAFFIPDPDRPPNGVPLPGSGILLLGGAVALGIGFGRRKPATSH